MAITMHAPNLLYLWASLAHPSKALVGGIVAVEQAAYGFGFAGYTVFLLQLSRGQKFATTHYAISTGLMGLSGMVAGYFSGDIAKAVGFPWFFGIVCLAAIPGLVTLFFVPLHDAPANEPA
jgi:PAT family beta-lactamase induction signal transducer AmpG